MFLCTFTRVYSEKWWKNPLGKKQDWWSLLETKGGKNIVAIVAKLQQRESIEFV